MIFNVITLFPEIYSKLDFGVLGKAIEKDLISLNTIQLRNFAINKHGQIDGKIYGEEEGMVLRIEPLENALKSINTNKKNPVINFSPQGQLLNQDLLKKLSKENELVLINGRYEGIDQRFIDKHVDLEISLGDYVLSNGDLACLVFIDSISRLVKGVIGKEASYQKDSLYKGLLKGPVYTRPEDHDGEVVPEVLISGNHQKIANWRALQSLKTTLEKRPEIFDKIKLTKKQKKLLEELDSKRIL